MAHSYFSGWACSTHTGALARGHGKSTLRMLSIDHWSRLTFGTEPCEGLPGGCLRESLSGPIHITNFRLTWCGIFQILPHFFALWFMLGVVVHLVEYFHRHKLTEGVFYFAYINGSSRRVRAALTLLNSMDECLDPWQGWIQCWRLFVATGH